MKFQNFPFASVAIAAVLLASLIWTASADAQCRVINGQMVCDVPTSATYAGPVRRTTQRATYAVRNVASAPVRVVRRGIFGRSARYSSPSTSYGSSGQYQSYGSAGSYQSYASPASYTEVVETTGAPEQTTAAQADTTGATCNCENCTCGDECRRELAELREEFDAFKRRAATGSAGLETDVTLPAPPTSSIDPIRDDALVAAEWRLRESQRIPSINPNHEGAVHLAAVGPRR